MDTYETIDTKDALEAIKDGTLSPDSVFINYAGTADRPTVTATVGANVTYRDEEGEWAKLVTLFGATEDIDVEHDWGEPGHVDARAEVIAAASGWLERLGYRVGAAKYPRADWYVVERV